jgi:hypothetical protein
MLISLPMHCFTAFLTSLISQALLQAALDKESSVLSSRVLLREFLNLPVLRQTEAQQHFVQCQCHDRLATIGEAYKIDFKCTRLSNPFKCQCQQSWLFFEWEECLAQITGGDWLATISTSTGERREQFSGL